MKLKYPLMDEEPGAAGGSAAEGGEGGQEGGQGEGGGAAGSGGSALATGGEPPAPLHERIPEKYRVFEGEGDDQQFNLEASTDKLAEGYSNLVKRLGADEAPPESPEGYELSQEEFGEGVDVEAIMKDEKTQGFLKRMHAKGMTNAQVQEVMKYGLTEWAPELTQGAAEVSAEDCITALKSDVWKSDSEFKENMGYANRAFNSLPEDIKAEVAKTDSRLGNDPVFNQIMAMFGKEMAEDTPVAETGGAGDGVNIEELMLSEEYRNPKHPKHEEASKKVKAYFNKKYSSKVA